MACTSRALRLFQRQQCRQLKVLSVSTSNNFRSFSSGTGKQDGNGTRNWNIVRNGVLAATGASVAVYVGYQFLGRKGPVYALKPRKKEDEVKQIKLTSRERRFLRFASVEYDGQLYMTPQDFLESVVEAEPRPRLKRKALNKADLQAIKDSTPALQRGSAQMFRNLRDKGIISYTEYLFLLSILTKPQTGFRIAFNMFDTDGNGKVDKNEFLVLLHLIPIAHYRQESTVQNLQLYVRNFTESMHTFWSASGEITLPPPSADKVPLYN